MPNIIRGFYPDRFYHIYNRGFNKNKLFYDDSDYERFLFKIAFYQKENPQIEILAYCLLPNHFHFLLRERLISKKDFSTTESTFISKFMKKLQVSHAMYFNKKYGEKVKNGLKSPVYEGRFRSRSVESEDYLTQVQIYIDYNAVKHGLVSNPQDWKYSSFDESQSVRNPLIFKGEEFSFTFN